MNEIKLKGKLNRWIGEFEGKEAEIILEPRELLEQLTHKEIGELLDLINLPQSKEEDNIKDGCYTCGQKWFHHDPEKCIPKQEFCEPEQKCSCGKKRIYWHCHYCNSEYWLCYHCGLASKCLNPPPENILPPKTEERKIERNEKLNAIIHDHSLSEDNKIVEVIRYIDKLNGGK